MAIKLEKCVNKNLYRIFKHNGILTIQKNCKYNCETIVELKSDLVPVDLATMDDNEFLTLVGKLILETNQKQ